MSELHAKFTSNQNKGLVWKLLADDGVFQGIPETKANAVKEEFDRRIQTIARQMSPADNLVNLDKRVIAEMMQDIGKYKTSEEMTLAYNAAEIAQNRQKVFENELQHKKKEFETMNSKPVPEKIDFSDALDSPIGSEMDKILAEQIALREKQLNMVLQTQDKESATKWIQPPGDTKIQKLVELQEHVEPVKLRIGEKIDLKAGDLKAKRVVFADTITQAEQADNNDNFLSLLKKKDPPPKEDMMTMLREILEKQNQILAFLTNEKN
jgi:hypothetical protein